jgi:hypothetical protein
MNDTLTLHGVPVGIASSEGQAFVLAAVRAGEGLLTDQELQETFEISPSDFAAIT